MKYQKPAEGILLKRSTKDSRAYEVYCECGNSDHYHAIDVSSDDCASVTVGIYTTSTTSYWDETFKKRYDISCPVLQEIDWWVKDLVNGFINRIKLTWRIWRTGTVKTESHVIMTQQQAYNYAKTLEQAVNDISEFERNFKVDQ